MNPDRRTTAARPRRGQAGGAADPSPIDGHWMRMARELFEQGHDERAVLEALRKAGCLSYVRADVVKATRGHFRNLDAGANRIQGLSALATGVLMWAGAAFCFYAAHAIDGRLTAQRLMLGALALFIAGLTPVVVGGYKMLTGSSTPVDTPARR